MTNIRNIALRVILPAFFVFFILFALFGFLYRYDNKYTAGAPYGEDGIFAFSQSDLARSKPLFLIDGWELYLDRKYSPDDFAAGVDEEPAQVFIGQYSNFSFLESGHSPFGEATYRILLRCDAGPVPLSLEIPEVFTEFTLWIDGAPMAQRGDTPTVDFVLDGEAELVLTVENDTHYYSGLYYPPALGAPGTIARMLMVRMIFYTALCICALTLALYSAVLWLSRERDPLFFHFGFFCLCFCVCCFHPFLWQAGLSGRIGYAAEDLARFGMLFQAVEIGSLTAGFSERRWFRHGVRPALIGICILSVLSNAFIVPSLPGFIKAYGVLVDFANLLGWGYLCVCAAQSLKRKSVGGPFVLSGSCALGASCLVTLLNNNCYEPIFTGWQTEYAGLLLVIIFGGLMVCRSRELLRQNRQLVSHMEELVEARTAELHTVLEERKNFFSDMAHNLKAPIAAVHGFINLIREGNLYLDDELREYIHLIEDENDEIRRRVQTLNTLNNFDRIAEPRAPLEVDELLERVSRDNSPDAGAAGIYLAVEKLNRPARIYGQSEKLLTLFENLIYNSISFCREGAQIIIQPSVEDGAATFRVSDTGCGIAPEHLPHIFERFYSGREDKSEGSGLGLYIARITVEELGGSISAESTVGKGTRFTVRIPLMEEVS